MTLMDVMNLIVSLGIVDKSHVYAGKLDNKKEKCIGCYHLRRSGYAHIPIGGKDNITYDVKAISFLVHWNRNQLQTEETAQRLYDALVSVDHMQINECVILFCRLLVPEPQDVGTDDNGIYEAVIEVEFYTERKG